MFMESNGASPRLEFDAGCQVGDILVATGLLSETWNASCSAYRTAKPFVVYREEEEGRVVIAFKGYPDFEVFKGDGKFGECEIEKNGAFGFLDEAALVHRGVLRKFMDIWENSEIQKEVLTIVKEKKTLVFTGHSLGGAIASLATLCVWEKYQRRATVFCVTFGCPLIGDDKFCQAIRCKGLTTKFCHVVSVNDIVSRVLLAPLELIHEFMLTVLPYWFKKMVEGINDKINNVMADIPLSSQQIADFYFAVLHHASAVVTLSKPACMTAPSSMIIDSIKSVFNLSPYRPFGCYLFCSKSGAVCVENHEAVLQLLYYTLENMGASLDLAGKACISEHTEYGSCFARILSHRMRYGGLGAHLALPVATSPYDICIALQLEALGLGLHTMGPQLALQHAGEVEMRLCMNSSKQVGELSKAQRAMAELEWYKKRCRDEGVGYYDSFRLQKDRKDFRANINCVRLAVFWDEIIQMLENNELPEDFPSRNKWIYSATAYRQLVEPLEIANYYRVGKHEVSGHYLSTGRPHRYQILEKWLEDKVKSEKQERKPRTAPASLTQDSCFWAYLEELRHSFEKNPTESIPKLKEFEKRVMHMIDVQELSSEVFLDNSSFMIWWKSELPPIYKHASCLSCFMDEGWKEYCKLG
uniref:Fungal lipase-like domain-containing protein n=1 Tax=Araucaria cunninghamii TaxID=56994 RepID=A0A0D6R0R3_ARACU